MREREVWVVENSQDGLDWSVSLACVLEEEANFRHRELDVKYPYLERRVTRYIPAPKKAKAKR